MNINNIVSYAAISSWMIISVCVVHLMSTAAAEVSLPSTSIKPGSGHETDAKPAELTSFSSTKNVLSNLIRDKQQFYQAEFPELEFIILEGGEAWTEEITALSVLLGNEPVNLDYEHPAPARADLMYVSLERIRIMLESNTPSASLFLADEPMGWSDRLCVITINPAEIARNDHVATHYLIEPYYEIRGKIRQENHLDHTEFAEFVFDHEVYHCLESHFIGPQPMSFLEFWSDYHDYRHENGADAFAVAMHMKRHGTETEFVKNLRRIRGLTLYCDDCNHWTPRILQQVSDTNPEKLESMDTMKLFRYATSLRDNIVPEYRDYLVYRSTAKAVCQQIGSSLWTTEEEGQLPSPDPVLVDDMLRVFMKAYRDLTGEVFQFEPTR